MIKYKHKKEKKFKSKLKELRIKNNLSQDELAIKLFVTRQAISKWENGICCPDIDTIKKIANIFNISIEELMNISNQQPKVITINNEIQMKKSKTIFYILFSILFAVMTVFLHHSFNRILQK